MFVGTLPYSTGARGYQHELPRAFACPRYHWPQCSQTGGGVSSGSVHSGGRRDGQAVANAEAAFESASIWAFEDRRRRANREAWREYHIAQAERCEELGALLAQKHRAKAAALSEGEE